MLNKYDITTKARLICNVKKMSKKTKILTLNYQSPMIKLESYMKGLI